MGIVYLAQDERLGRRVALKSLPAGASMQPDLRERLRREARAAATISHPAVAVVYALEEVGDNLFIATEYVQGETLRSVIAHGPLPPDRARSIATDIAGALAAAHDAGVIHRDLKPENVLIKSDGSVKVVDFGIAHVEGTDVSRLTRPGFALGTPAYMAPEQLLGGQVDPRADVYAWGVVLSEMLQGHHPLDRVTTDTPSRPVGAAWATIINRCLQPDPNARPNARELVQALGSDPFAPVQSSPAVARRPTLWWWEFHQGMTALIYWVMVIPAWYARGHIGGIPGRAVLHHAAGVGDRRREPAPAPLVLVAVLRLGADVGARSFQPMDQGCGLGVRGGAHRWRRADPRCRLAPVDSAAIGGDWSSRGIHADRAGHRASGVWY